LGTDPGLTLGPLLNGKSISNPTPELVARMLDLVATQNVDHALSDIEQLVSRLRADAAATAEAREVLRNVPADVLREAMRLRATWIGRGR
jgi:hypothetical protein